MNILIDMNLSPDWVSVLAQGGYTAAHWSAIGNPRAADSEILAWALENKWVIFTHDLDFGTILAATALHAPSVIQNTYARSTPWDVCSDLARCAKTARIVT